MVSSHMYNRVLIDYFCSLDLIGNERISTFEDDPQCGETTGGKEECIWDCERLNFFRNSSLDNVQTTVVSSALTRKDVS